MLKTALRTATRWLVEQRNLLALGVLWFAVAEALVFPQNPSTGLFIAGGVALAFGLFSRSLYACASLLPVWLAAAPDAAFYHTHLLLVFTAGFTISFPLDVASARIRAIEARQSTRR
ncbi:hypothetical protein BX589_1025 [Paraburkholderia fungorum]|jgi:hypothetical protein|uniref:hypothetical protein n=1 Tax=Paraburkholderia fungorum TaxID=134537 RepID=UPI000D08471D|nr:hypothetical protein [Paraburkholderia fungorum]PRZ55810.1 hypothetical protein BX589_1025 [Paraburkholderia fungorum]